MNTRLVWSPEKRYFFLMKKLIQWGPEHLTSLVFEWSKVGRPLNGSVFECHLNTAINLVRHSDHHL